MVNEVQNTTAAERVPMNIIMLLEKKIIVIINNKYLRDLTLWMAVAF